MCGCVNDGSIALDEISPVAFATIVLKSPLCRKSMDVPDAVVPMECDEPRVDDASSGAVVPAPPAGGADLDDTFVAGSAQQSYQKNHDEIQRRQQQALGGESQHNPRSFERAAGAPDVPFRNDSQTHFVWSASHAEMPPRARDERHPALRVYGCFASQAEATEHARVVAELDPTCSLMVSPTHEWCMLPRSAARLDAAPAHIAAVLAAYDAEREKSSRAFRENVAQRRGGEGLRRKPDKEEADAPADAAPPPRRLGRDAEVRDQSVVAATFVKDAAGHEPVFRVYGGFESTAAADAWARCAGDHVLQHDIDVVATCQWLFVNDVEGEKIAQEVFRSNELNAIIAQHKKEPALVENYRKWREESESEA